MDRLKECGIRNDSMRDSSGGSFGLAASKVLTLIAVVVLPAAALLIGALFAAFLSIVQFMEALQWEIPIWAKWMTLAFSVPLLVTFPYRGFLYLGTAAQNAWSKESYIEFLKRLLWGMANDRFEPPDSNTAC